MPDVVPSALAVVIEGPNGPHTYISLDAKGRATGFNGHVDLGTGITTALAQIVAEELDLPLSNVEIVLGDTARTPDQGPTIASETIQVAAIPLRKAAAQARIWLADRGARALNAPLGQVALKNGVVHWKDTQRSYADLLLDQNVTLTYDPDTPTKDPKDYTIVGTKTPRRDLEDKLRGAHLYIHDLNVEGMVHGHVLRPPYAGRDSGDFVGRSLIGYDESAVQDMPGFIAVVREADFLGVVAETAALAQAIAEALPTRWRMPPNLPDMSKLADTIRHQPATPRVLDGTGDFDTALEQADHVKTRSYIWPYHEHGSIGPSCSIADWNGAQPIIWSGTQNPHMLRGDLAELVGLNAEAIEIRRYQAAGCYGRNCADDVGADALLLSRAVGRPVRVQLTRAQEHLWEPKGAAQVMDVQGGLKKARLDAYAIDTWYPSNRAPNLGLLLTGRVDPAPRPADMGDRTIVPPYEIANKRITVHDMAPIVRASWMRGVSALPNTFAHESFMDEMAFEAGEDPVAFRLRHLKDPRAMDLVRRTAEAAGYVPHDGPRLRREGRMAYGQGFAYATYVHGPFPGTAAAAAAWVVDVAVDLETGETTLSRVFVGQDQGLVINPDGVRQQIHGNVIQTASRVMAEEITFDEIAPRAQSWAAYPIQTFPAVPDIETMLIERPDEPALGVGESAAVPSAAAIANAIFDATGVRMREVPFTPEKLRRDLAVQAGGRVTLPSTQTHPAKKSRKIGALVAALGGVLTFGAVSVPLHRSIPPTTPPAPATFSAETLARGKEVFALGDCAVCHTAEGGVKNAGGRAVPTPFGTVYTTNLTPDPETGLGRWSFEAFERAMRRGISREGHTLYPAFPYTSFAKIDGADMYALYAYLQTLPAVSSPTPKAQMIAPANLRNGVAAWNWLYHDATPFAPDPAQSEAWNRGKYLVEAAGHCSGCHAPRNGAGAEMPNMTGAVVEGWYAPPLEGLANARMNWDEASLFAYLRKGHAPNASASGPMAEVVESLQEVPDPDIRAMSVYLASLMAPAPDSLPETRALPREADLPPSRASRLFESACASCHDPVFADSLTVARIPLTRAPVLRAPTSEALTSVLNEGLRAPEGLDLRDMPSFRDEFSDADLTELTQYLRARFAPDLPAWR
ncbi:molybdopterin cofactor-binding domain-containing protein [Celeribacter baekdonensis]|uniref:Cytochrome c domain-containing protein n=1 Tax=Celeribacter baekdonensis B30 TaxID=1208323 RepID=K2J2K2_9RHOB|nr:molybdopterin cofactor-binding domain-containing protein [Celeribacter baekdonensis]EKE69323.1 hypothetical protein B30_16183 [Celeribacter baekdonensis B30]